MSYKVLIADDHPLFRDALSTILRMAIKDCKIQEAKDYKETAKMLEREHFNIVFLDLNMPPGPDGEWTAEQIQKLDPYTNIELVSGFMRTSPAKFAKQSNLPDKLLYLQKPFHRQEILQFATALSEKWQAELKLRNGNELKLVYPQTEDAAQPEKFCDWPFDHFFLQPLDDIHLEENTRSAVAYCLEHPQGKLSLQTHKRIGID